MMDTCGLIRSRFSALAACLMAACFVILPASTHAFEPGDQHPVSATDVVDLDRTLVELEESVPLYTHVPDVPEADPPVYDASQLIPEPSTLAMAGLASMFGLAGLLRKRWG